MLRRKRYAQATLVMCVDRKGRVRGEVTQDPTRADKLQQIYCGEGVEIYVQPMKVGIPQGNIVASGLEFKRSADEGGDEIPHLTIEEK